MKRLSLIALSFFLAFNSVGCATIDDAKQSSDGKPKLDEGSRAERLDRRIRESVRVDMK